MLLLLLLMLRKLTMEKVIEKKIRDKSASQKFLKSRKKESKVKINGKSVFDGESTTKLLKMAEEKSRYN